MKLTEEQKKQIELIPVDGWWQSSSQEAFEKDVIDLMEHDYTFEEALKLVDGLYWTISGEYGN